MSEITFLQLKKNCKKNADGYPEYKLAILGDCATQHLADAVRGYAYEVGLRMDVFDADYNQIDAQVMDEKSELYAFEPQSVLIYMCTEKLYEMFCAVPVQERADFANAMYEKIRGYWTLISRQCNAKILQFTFAGNDDRVFGNYGLKTSCSFAFQLLRLNYLLSEGCQQFKNVYLIDLNVIQSEVGRRIFHDEKLYYIAKMPVSTEALPMVAKSVLDTVVALTGRMKKCVILDLDNTLWGGVIGDDGMDGIQIGELGLGHAFTEFQMWLKELKNRGIILAVCSKNNEDTAKEPFLKHPEMVLRMEDISLFVANWDDKATNIRAIQKTLNIGMDSIVFLDDNPFERNLVKSLIPDITVPELPEDPAQYLSYLKGLNLFETVSYSEEDRDRTRQYQAEISRTALQQQFGTFDEYLESLEMKAVAAPFDSFHYPRIAQLTQRSNQFNLRTVRYTEAEIEAIAQDDSHLTLYFTLKDKFGDHGLISVVILDKQDADTLFVSEWLMSCRVLKRGMEEFIVNKIVETAQKNGFRHIRGEYIPTPKNAMVKDLYENLGFQRIAENTFEADADNFSFHKTYISEE